jgi:putative drug exporter of the RND superfamily
MARRLQRLGAFAVRRRRTVVTAWLAAFAVVTAMSVTFAGEFDGDFSIPGTESQRAGDLIESRGPAAGDGAPAGRVVFATPAGQTLTSGAGRAAVARAVEAIGRVPGVRSASDPLESSAVSADGRVAFSDLDFARGDDQATASPRAGIERASGPARQAGLQVEFAGAAAGGGQGGDEGFPVGELLGVSVAILVLAITFGSMIAAGLPLLTALLGVGFGILGIMLATSVTSLSDESVTLAVMLGLAVGIDYTLFILTRHRTQVRDGMGIEASIARAVGTAGSAVVFAGATVIIALVALLVTGVPFLGQMGIAAASTIAVAVLLSLTLVPALMAIAGPRATRGKSSSAALHDPGAGETPTLGARWIALVMRRRLLAIAVPVLALGAFALPALDMRLGETGDGALGPETTQRRAYDLLSDGFGAGFNGPLTIVAEVAPSADGRRTADAAATRLERLDGVAAVSPAELNPAGDLAVMQLTPDSAPSSAATEDLVDDIRGQAGRIRADTGATVLVTGQTASDIDTSQRMSDALIPYLSVVMGLALILLTLAFRSILIPLTAIGGFLLTIVASFGAVVTVFQDGFGASLLGVSQAGPIVSLLPVIVIGVLFGLAMDYQVFLVSRMREEYKHGATPSDAIRDGFRHGARVVTAAALIMIAVFSGFIVPDDPIIKSVGFAFAFGIMVDAFLVRLTLIPALMTAMGRHAWWLPSWLDRLLPDVDLEGSSLDDAPPVRSQPAGAPATEPVHIA